MTRRLIGLPWLFLALVLLSGCEQRSESLRYRLTVEVDTPDGVKRGSSVVAVNVSQTGDDAWFVSPQARGVRATMRGEAAAVDLPGGQVLFALLRNQQSVDAGKWYAHNAVYAPQFRGEYSGIHRTQYLKHRPGSSGELTDDARPMLVTFGDLSDPTSVMLVDPDDLPASFGEGVALKQITVAITKDPVTTGIEERLGWMDEFRKAHFDGTSTLSEDLTTSDIRAHLSSGNFSTEFAK
ncbi:hypothetical protein [Alterisphingorhabdus coralli]|uniref:Lipoprotein n=1 Tax=Alterisphingorhabdus coralli TaxID=3071408 RepID=A0AA97F8U6_9SPHN|nr:hypothetical protein [Parasphingorhabdus sp. SCSIO 66989]WOE76093.1 hypothetical protein RB602_05080 [Parasphingorhabdus sp. SCSIO 66989]